MTNDERIMSEWCEAIFKLYQSFIKAGFNDNQAFYLTSEILKGGIK